MTTTVLQRSFDDLGTPLYDVTFCVLDLETTGASPADCAITEIGAVKVRGGECLGTFHTLVNPGVPIPPAITVLTGITEAMVIPAPPVPEVLPAFLEFAEGTVLVGHNVRFDLSFLNAALDATGRPRLEHRVVDTLGLARRLVRDEVPNLRLGTLADRLRLSHRPAHRALDDALATADLLHVMLERAGTLGVTGLDDLLGLPSMSGHAQAGKLKLTDALPRSPGVYLFRDRHGHVLYVGKATNLRARVRSYFSTDDRRKIGALLRETASVDHRVCATTLEAAVLEVRLIHALQPRYNRQAKNWKKYCYLKLTLDEAFPRLSVARTARADGGLYLGPLSSAAMATLAAEAIQTVAPLRRCTERLRAGGAAVREAPCSAGQLGVALCPCAGGVSRSDYDAVVARVVRGLTREPALLFEPLLAKMAALAGAERFEEAAAVRDRAEALATALRRQRRLDGLVRAGRIVLDTGRTGFVELTAGRLTGTGRLLRPWEVDRALLPDHAADPGDGPEPGAVPRHLVDELLAVAAWLDRNHVRARLVEADPDGVWASDLPVLPSFSPR